ncbi:MAG: SGNH/GDSL hydrolase family protein [Candidatus Omnitrophica bacterium]|nr:SGNH/GDSL hydrolase family protein [Candidatus Omnitrophota bacterium]
MPIPLSRQKWFQVIIQVIVFFLIFEIWLNIGGIAFLCIQRFKDGKISHNPDIFKIVCLGDSVTAYSQYPDYLEELLNRDKKSFQIKVYNRGLPNATSKNVAELLPKILRDFDPQMITVMTGLRDNEQRLQKQNTESMLKGETRAKPAFALRTIGLLQEMLMNLKSRERPWILQKGMTYYRGWLAAQHPDDPQAIFFFGLNLAKEGAYEKALQTFFKLRRWENFIADKENIIGDFYIEHGRADLAQRWFEFVSSIPKLANSTVYLRLFERYQQNGYAEKAVFALKKALSLSQDGDILPTLKWSNYLAARRSFPEAENCLQAALGWDLTNEKKIAVYEALKKCYELQNQPGQAALISKQIKKLVTTQSKYKTQIWSTALAHGCQLVVLQYPMLPVEQVEREYNYSADIIYIDNQQSFEAAVKANGYFTIFGDFGGSVFGHLKKKGSELLAENIAQNIKAAIRRSKKTINSP